MICFNILNPFLIILCKWLFFLHKLSIHQIFLLFKPMRGCMELISQLINSSWIVFLNTISTLLFCRIDYLLLYLLDGLNIFLFLFLVYGDLFFKLGNLFFQLLYYLLIMLIVWTSFLLDYFFLQSYWKQLLFILGLDFTTFCLFKWLFFIQNFFAKSLFLFYFLTYNWNIWWYLFLCWFLFGFAQRFSCFLNCFFQFMSFGWWFGWLL